MDTHIYQMFSNAVSISEPQHFRLLLCANKKLLIG